MRKNYKRFAAYIKKNYRLRKLARRCLASPVANNPFFDWFYSRKIQKEIRTRKENVRNLLLETTNLCGADCIICPHKTMKRQKGIMDLALSKKIIDEYTGYGLNLNGFGEPFKDPYIFERIEYAKTKGIPLVGLFTNGMFLNAKKIAQSPLDEIHISIDGATPQTHGKIRPGIDPKRVVSNVLELLSYKERPRVLIEFVENKYNTHEIKEFWRKWKRKADSLIVVPIHSWTKKMTSIKRDPCYMLWEGLYIDWQGRAVLCCLDYESKEILGDTRKQSLKEIRQGIPLKTKRDEHSRGKFNGLCKNCNYNLRERGSWWA